MLHQGDRWYVERLSQVQRKSPLGHSGQVHALIQAFAPSEEVRIIARIGGAQAADAEAWVERKSGRYSRSCLIQRALQTERGSKKEMGEKRIAVGLDASSEPTPGFGIRTELDFGHSYKMQPPVDKDIAGRETKSLHYMAFGLISASQIIFCHPDNGMRVGQIAIKRQGMLAFRNRLGGAVCHIVDGTQDPVG